MESEAPGPELEALATSIRDTARRLWVLYVGLTGAMILMLSLFAWSGIDERMSFYEAVAHAFTTLPTGGFSTKARSIEEFGAATQWAIALFMVLAGANFALMYRALLRNQWRKAGRDEELRLYFALLALGSVVRGASLAASLTRRFTARPCVRLNGRVIDERALRAISVFVLLYLIVFALGSLGLVIESARAGVEVSPFEAISAAATTIGNVGPGFGFLGPFGSFEPFSGLSKIIMIVLMWMGRLELLPVVVLLTRSYWRA